MLNNVSCCLSTLITGQCLVGLRKVSVSWGELQEINWGKNLLVSPLHFYSSPLTKILIQDRYNFLDGLAYISGGRQLIARIFPSSVLCHFLVLWLLVFEKLPTTLSENRKSSGQKRNTKQTKSLDLLKSQLLKQASLETGKKIKVSMAHWGHSALRSYFCPVLYQETTSICLMMNSAQRRKSLQQLQVHVLGDYDFEGNQ